jgi:hypothetical protein
MQLVTTTLDRTEFKYMGWRWGKILGIHLSLGYERTGIGLEKKSTSKDGGMHVILVHYGSSLVTIYFSLQNKLLNPRGIYSFLQS